MQLVNARRWNQLNRLIPIGVAILAVPLWVHFQFPGYLSHLFDAIPGEVWPRPTELGGEGRSYYGGDQVQILYLAWKLKQNLLHHWSILTDHFTFAARNGVHHDLCFGPQFWLIAFVSLFVGDIAAYNVGFVLLPLAFTFVAGYYLFGVATSSRWVRALLAAGMTIVPLRVVELMMGHSTGSIFWAVPLYWGVVLRHRLGRGVRGGDALAGLILLTTVISEEHQGLYLMITSAIVFCIWGLQDMFPLRRPHLAIGKLLWRWKYLLAGVAAVAAWGLFYNYMLLTDAGGRPRFARPAWDIRLYSQPLRNFVGLDGESNIGAWLLRALPVGALALLLFGRVRWKRIATSVYLPFALALPIVLFLAVGLGPDWSQQTGVYEWFYAHVPFFSAQRVSIKIFTACATFLALLSAALYQTIVDERRLAVTAQNRVADIALGLAQSVVLAAVVLQPVQYVGNIHERWRGVLLTDMRGGPRHIFFYLRTHLGPNDIVLTVPFNVLKSRWETYPDFLAFRSHARFADGYFGMHPHYFDEAARAIGQFNSGMPSEEVRAIAGRLGYTYLLLNRDQWPLPVPVERVQMSFDHAPWLERLMCDGAFCLYRFQ